MCFTKLDNLLIALGLMKHTGLFILQILYKSCGRVNRIYNLNNRRILFVIYEFLYINGLINNFVNKVAWNYWLVLYQICYGIKQVNK